jgi:hypothetical protein
VDSVRNASLLHAPAAHRRQRARLADQIAYVRRYSPYYRELYQARYPLLLTVCRPKDAKDTQQLRDSHRDSHAETLYAALDLRYSIRLHEGADNAIAPQRAPTGAVPKYG